jgi:hypothetical protein
VYPPFLFLLIAGLLYTYIIQFSTCYCWLVVSDSRGGGIKEIEFRIYSDGRVTKIVWEVRGKNCQDITKAINKQLGNVVASQPTEEMFEEEVFIQKTLEQKVDGGWEGGGGTSSW